MLAKCCFFKKNMVICYILIAYARSRVNLKAMSRRKRNNFIGGKR